MNFLMKEDQLNIAENLAIDRVESEAYKLVMNVKPELQEKTFNAYKELITLGIRLMVEEIYKQNE